MRYTAAADASWAVDYRFIALGQPVPNWLDGTADLDDFV